MTSVLAIGAVAALLLVGTSGTAPQPRWLGIIGLVIGLVFLALAVRLARRRGQISGLSAASTLLDDRTSRQISALGAVAGAGNPKTLPICLTGVAVIAANSPAPSSRFLGLVILVAVASLGVAFPPLILGLVSPR